MHGNSFKRIYVWELPVRFFHWLNAICIVALAVTGYLIGAPRVLENSLEAWASSWFGTVRFLHFSAAYVLTFTFLFRIYWAFRGNDYARWSNFLLVTRRQWKEVLHVLRLDVLQAGGKPLTSLGHNALASLIYFFSFVVFVVQVATGFALYAPMSSAWYGRLFGWVSPLLGGDITVRSWHHVLMWFFPIFLLMHVYLVVYHDYVEGRGVMSSMVGGWKFVESDRQQERAP